MVKIATVRKTENEKQKAAEYMKNTVVIPSALLGLISILLGYGALIYLMFKGGNLAILIMDSMILLFGGIVLGVFQCLYHRYLFDRFPDYYAQRKHRTEQIRSKNIKKINVIEKPKHPGRWIIPYIYLLGFSGMLGLIVYYAARLNPMSAAFLLLAGFYNLRFFFWKWKLGI